MKLGKEPGGRVRQPKAPDLIQPKEGENDLVFDPERDLGEAYRQSLLKHAEEYLQQQDDEESGDEAEQFRAFPFLATHKLLFPRHRTELDALLEKYKVKEEIIGKPEMGMSFLEKMILFPEMKHVFAQQAEAHILSTQSIATGAGMPLGLLVKNGVQVASVKPEVLQTLRLLQKKDAIFQLLGREYHKKEWGDLVELAASARLLFPEEFTAVFLTSTDWEEMIKEGRNSNRPELAMNLAILAAEKVYFLPEGEVRINLPIRAIKSKLELPARDEI